MMASDCLASYGSLARFRDLQRMSPLSKNTLMGTSGDISDFQFTLNMLKKYSLEEECYDDQHHLSPRQWYTALSAFMYQRRSKMNPLWNTHIIGGVDPKTGESLLGCVNLIGTTFESSTIATGYGAYLAQPMLREAVEGREGELEEEDARALLKKCMMVLWYRDARSTDIIQLSKVTKDGCQIDEPFQVQQDWSISQYQFNNL